MRNLKNKNRLFKKITIFCIGFSVIIFSFYLPYTQRKVSAQETYCVEIPIGEAMEEMLKFLEELFVQIDLADSLVSEQIEDAQALIKLANECDPSSPFDCTPDCGAGASPDKKCGCRIICESDEIQSDFSKCSIPCFTLIGDNCRCVSAGSCDTVIKREKIFDDKVICGGCFNPFLTECCCNTQVCCCEPGGGTIGACIANECTGSVCNDSGIENAFSDIKEKLNELQKVCQTIRDLIDTNLNRIKEKLELSRDLFDYCGLAIFEWEEAGEEITEIRYLLGCEAVLKENYLREHEECGSLYNFFCCK